MKNVYLFSVGCLLSVILTAWTFNHINAWVGIGLGIISSYYFISQFKTFIK